MQPIQKEQHKKHKKHKKHQNKHNVFISYCHRDKEWLERLQVHLTPLTRDLGINVWDDSRIKPGMEWKKEITTALDAAQAAILLISPDFMASEFITSSELPSLLKAANDRGVLILPIILSKSRFDRTPELNKFQAVNELDKPLKGLPDFKQDELLDEAVELIENHFITHPPTKTLGAFRGIGSEPETEPTQVSNSLLDLIIRFLTQYDSRYFNAVRMYNWGTKQPGFEQLGHYSTTQIRHALETLLTADRVKRKKSKKGSSLYMIN